MSSTARTPASRARYRTPICSSSCSTIPRAARWRSRSAQRAPASSATSSSALTLGIGARRMLPKLVDAFSDHVIERVSATAMSLRAGKLPAAMSGRAARRVPHRDPRVLVGPGIGRDAAVIDIGGGRVLVAKTDPVTFAADDIGWYAVQRERERHRLHGRAPGLVPGDGAAPAGRARRPSGADLRPDHRSACAALDIELVGGHTEVTLGIDRPIVVGAMLGEAARDEIVTRRRHRARRRRTADERHRHRRHGAARARGAAAARARAASTRRRSSARAALLFDPGISVVADAQALCARRAARLHARPDGGRHRHRAAGDGRRRGRDAAHRPGSDARARRDAHDLRALGLDPLGLLASGALLAIVPADAAARVARAAIMPSMARVIGRVDRWARPRVILGAEDRNTLPIVRRATRLARFFDGVDGGHEHRDAHSPEGSRCA